MVLIRHAAAPLRAVRCVRQPVVASPSSHSRRCLSVTARRPAGSGHNESQYDPPGGWLWGIKPGEKPEPEGWEWPMYLFCGGLVAAAIGLAYKPDTSVSTWALEEARRRLEAEGILPDPNPDTKDAKKE